MIETVRNGVKALRRRVPRHQNVVQAGFLCAAVVKDHAGRIQFIGIGGRRARIGQNLYDVRGSRQKMQLWNQRVNLLQKGVQLRDPFRPEGGRLQQASYAFP